MVKRNTCVFISGAGTNLKALIKNSREYNSPINIKLIISSTKKAKGLNFARIYKIPYFILDLNNQLNLALGLKTLKKNDITLICLAGYMKILKKKFINKYDNKIINIHPSLLPKYKGLDTFKRILKSKENITGCTVHYVNDKIDSGRIILKKKVYIKKNDTEMSLKTKVQQAEYKTYSEAIIRIFR
ncbi:phosphoribosylglycinamide formyltransferase [Pelagibacteraceae bacterium]|nr:phosphoribosylglycinamide formyltransferase [Pelagibacteraceae bacterium]